MDIEDRDSNRRRERNDEDNETDNNENEIKKIKTGEVCNDTNLTNSTANSGDEDSKLLQSINDDESSAASNKHGVNSNVSEETADQNITSNSSALEKDDNKVAENILTVFKESEEFNLCAAVSLLINPNDSKVHPVPLSNKRLKVANDIFTRVLNNDHTDSVAIQGFSLSFLHSRRWEDAVAFSTQCLELDLSSRDMGLAFARRALANSMLGNFPDVVQDLNGALNHLLPGRARETLVVYRNRLHEQLSTKSNELKISGDISFTSGDYPAALDFYTKAWETNPNNIDALGGIAIVQGILLRWEDAVASNTALLETNLSDDERMAAIFRRGYANAKLNQAAEAIEDLERALSMNLPAQQRDKAQRYVYKMKELKLSEDRAKLEQEIKNARASLEAERAEMEAERSKVMALKASEDVHMETGEEKSSPPVDAQDEGEDMSSSSVSALTKKTEEKAEEKEKEEDSASDDDTATGDEAEWDLTKIYTIKELNKKKPTMCDRANDGDVNCGLVACSRWESKGQKPWNTCLDCQVNDFKGFPDESDELPIDYMTEEHRTVISDKCSHPKKKKKFPNLLTFKPLVARQLSDNPNPSRSLFEHISKDTPLPDKAYRWNENDEIRKVGRTLPSALELIKLGEKNGLRFVGVDCNGPAVESVTRLCVLHHPTNHEDQAERGVLWGIGPASAPHNSTMNTLFHQESSILSMSQSVGLDAAQPVIMETTAVVSICPYEFPAKMSTEKGKEHETYQKVRKESRLLVVEYVKALTQLFHNLVSVAFFGKAWPFYQDNLDMVDASMVDQVGLGLGGIAHPCSAKWGTLRIHSTVQLKVSATYYGRMLDRPYVFDAKHPKTEMMIGGTARLMQDEEKKRKIIESGEFGNSIKAGIANMSDEAEEERRASQSATCDKKREDEIPGLITIPVGSEHSILTQCTNPKCDNDEQRQTTQTISREDAGCDNLEREYGSSYDVYKSKGEDAEFYFTTSSKNPSNEIETKLKSQHRYVVSDRSIRNRFKDGKGIEAKKPDATYFAKKSTTTDMLKVLPHCSNCQCTMFPVDESQRRNTISLHTLYERRDRGLLPTKEEKPKAKKGKKRKWCLSFL